MRNDDVTPFKKNRGKQHANELWSMQGLFSRFCLFKRTSSKCIPCGLIHAKETSFSTKRKVVKDKHMASKQQFLPEKWSKFNSTLHSDLLIECQIKHIVRKISRAVFFCHHSLMAPCKIIQCYDQATVAFDF